MKKLIKMSNKEFDRFMCEKYPVILQERNLPKSQTCMCWGFNVGKGWHELLCDLCEKIDKLYKLTGIGVKAVQVKEKFGSLRFYTSPSFNERIKEAQKKIDNETAKAIVEALDDCVRAAEYKSDKICAECGEYYYDKITIGGCVYDVCEKCFIKIHPDRIVVLNEWKENNKFEQFVRDLAADYLYKKELPSEKCKKIMEDLLEEFKQYKKKEKAKEEKKNKEKK